jgi:anti-sigma factor RsiW
MTPRCDAPLSDDDLLDYWTDAAADGTVERVEAHLFACAECTARLQAMASLGARLASLVRRGRVTGIVSRVLLNRIQRDGVHVRFYVLSPGERVPCAAFPGDDLVVVSLRADLSAARTVTLSVSGPADEASQIADVPVSPTEVEILWATPGEIVRRLPSARVRLTLTSNGPDGAVLGEYELDHTASVEP